MSYKKIIFTTIFASVGSGMFSLIPVTQTYTPIETNTEALEKEEVAQGEILPETPHQTTTELPEISERSNAAPETAPKHTSDKTSDVFTVPFYSQFNDITPSEWKKIGCGVASLAMLIEYYEPGEITVDTLLQEGIEANAYLSNAGWTHAGLIELSKKYGLTGASHDMAGTSMESAFNRLKAVLQDGPVMVSVHYTFDPKNPIPHLVVVNGVKEGMVHYNDPAELSGGGTVSITQFQSAWKKRYIEIRPTV